MTRYEVQAENGHRIRVDAEDELEAVALASELDPDIELAGAVPADGLPVGADGGDAEDALELGATGHVD